MAVDLPPALIVAAPPTTGLRAIPFATSGIGHLMVRGELNGRPIDVLIDSGSTRTIVDRAWALAAGWSLSPLKERAYGAGGGNLALAQLDGARLSIGGVALSETPLYAIDLASVARSMRGSGVSAPQVILGSDLLRRHRALIDYAGNRLWLAP